MNKKILMLVVSTIFAINLFAQVQHPENCPFGGTPDCTGECGRFTDENEDGYCDYAILTKQKKEVKDTIQTQSQKTISENKNKKQTEKTSEVKKNEPLITEDVILSTNETTQTITESVVEQTQTTEINKNTRKFPYHLWQVLIATLGLYLFTYILVKAKVIKKVTHRKIWNTILCITFLVSCILGLYVVFAKMYSWSMDYLSLMKLHVDFGISMTVVALIHALWHMNYWKSFFKRVTKKQS